MATMYNQKNFTQYPLQGIPRVLWNRLKKFKQMSGMTMRAFILEAIKEKLDRDEPTYKE